MHPAPYTVFEGIEGVRSQGHGGGDDVQKWKQRGGQRKESEVKVTGESGEANEAKGLGMVGWGCRKQNLRVG